MHWSVVTVREMSGRFASRVVSLIIIVFTVNIVICSLSICSVLFLSSFQRLRVPCLAAVDPVINCITDFLIFCY